MKSYAWKVEVSDRIVAMCGMAERVGRRYGERGPNADKVDRILHGLPALVESAGWRGYYAARHPYGLGRGFIE